MRYNDAKLANINAIQIGTYHKDPKNSLVGAPMCCVYVQNIDNIGSNTVYAKIGDYDIYSEKNANAILDFINYGNTCYVAGTPT